MRDLSPLLARCSSDAVPLLVLRLPDLERIAWQRGRTLAREFEERSVGAFVRSAASVLRRDDVLVHDAGSDVFLAALTAPVRATTKYVRPADCRSALARIANALEEATGLRVKTGWTSVPTRVDETPESLLALARRALDRGARERERFAFFSMIGHELRTPLTAICGYLETLATGDLQQPLARRFLAIARAQAARMGRLVDGMFEVSLLDLGMAEAARERCELARALASAASALEPVAAERSFQFVIEAIDCCVALNEDRAIQIFVNLLENAIKHGRVGGKLNVRPLERTAQYIEIAFDDDGPGVAPAQREAVFTLGYRGGDTTRGAGIGLAVVKLIVNRAGGDVHVEQSPFGGACFVLRLPAIERDECAI